jgi:hypothetical protein
MAGPAARPTGITILAVLSAIGGIFAILGGLGAVVGGGFVGAVTGSGALGGMVTLIGLALLVLGVVELILAYGLWGLQPWAWQLGAILQVASVVIAILEVLAGYPVSSVVISVVIAGIILYYLNTPAVRQAFGRPATGWM